MKIASLCAALALASGGSAAAKDGFLIAITVDDLPAHGPLPVGTSRTDVARSYLATLKAHGVRQAFGFVNAVKVASDASSEAVLDLWRRAGYPLGNHSYSHMNLNRAESVAAWTADVVAGETLVARHMAGENWHYFRFANLAPGTGERQAAAAAVLKTRGYRIADVSVAFGDWVYTDAYVRCLAKGDQASIAAMKVRYLQEVDNGIAAMKTLSRRVYGRVVPQVLLTHLGAWSAVTLPDVMARLDAAGARYVTLERAQSDPAYVEAATLPGGGGIFQRTAKARQVNLSDIDEPKAAMNVKQLCR